MAANGYPGVSKNTNKGDAIHSLDARLAVVEGGGVAVGSITTADLADAAVTTPKIADLNVTTAKLAAAAVTKAKAAVFVSAVLTGTGASQNSAHGLGVIPAAVLIVPYDTAPATAGDYTAVEGVHTTTNVVVTVTLGKKFKVLAWA